MMPASQPATTNAPIRGANATRSPAAISIPPTTYMKSWPLPGTMSLIQPARYVGQSTVQLKNLSTPNRIGAAVKPIRSSQNAWCAAPLTSGPAVEARPSDGLVVSVRSGASTLVLVDMEYLLPAAPVCGRGARIHVSCYPVGASELAIS